MVTAKLVIGGIGVIRILFSWMGVNTFFLKKNGRRNKHGIPALALRLRQHRAAALRSHRRPNESANNPLDIYPPEIRVCLRSDTNRNFPRRAGGAAARQEGAKKEGRDFPPLSSSLRPGFSLRGRGTR